MKPEATPRQRSSIASAGSEMASAKRSDDRHFDFWDILDTVAREVGGTTEALHFIGIPCPPLREMPPAEHTEDSLHHNHRCTEEFQ